MTLNHSGKIALVTGANKGIGFEVARQLGKQGVTVLVGARNTELGQSAATKLKWLAVVANTGLTVLKRTLDVLAMGR